MSELTPDLHAPNGVKGLAKKKFLGVPVLYLLALFVVVLAVVAWRMKSSTSTTAASTTTDTSADPTATDADMTGTAPTDDNGDLLPTLSTGTVVADNTTTPPDPTVVATNDTWYKSAVEWLVDTQGANSGDAQVALQTYLSGGNVTFAQGQLRDAAIKQFGLPPTAPTAGQTAAKPAQKQGNPPCSHVVQGPNDSTWAAICTLYYGKSDSATIAMLRGANPSVTNTTAGFQPGTRLSIPAYHLPKFYTATTATRSLASIAAKNGISQVSVTVLNGSMKFPVAVGTKVRVA